MAACFAFVPPPVPWVRLVAATTLSAGRLPAPFPFPVGCWRPPLPCLPASLYRAQTGTLNDDWPGSSWAAAG